MMKNNQSNVFGYRNQYRRVIRYMKRWKNREFDSDGHAVPPGIGIG